MHCHQNIRAQDRLSGRLAYLSCMQAQRHTHQQANPFLKIHPLCLHRKHLDKPCCVLSQGMAAAHFQRTKGCLQNAPPRTAQMRMSSTATSRSSVQAANKSPSLFQQTSKMPPEASKVRKSFPDGIDQTLTRLSKEPDARYLPSGLKAREYTAWVCPLSSLKHSPLSISHNLSCVVSLVIHANHHGQWKRRALHQRQVMSSDLQIDQQDKPGNSEAALF